MRNVFLVLTIMCAFAVPVFAGTPFDGLGGDFSPAYCNPDPCCYQPVCPDPCVMISGTARLICAPCDIVNCAATQVGCAAKAGIDIVVTPVQWVTAGISYTFGGLASRLCGNCCN